MARKLADPKDMARWMWDASEKLNYPSAQKLYEYLKANNQHVPLEVIEKSFTQFQPERQLFFRSRYARRPRRTGPVKFTPPNLRQGRVPASDIHDRWMADLADLSAQPSGGESPYQYILVVLNVFSKQLWARALRSRTAAAVTDAFKEILQGQRPPCRLDTDAGNEFTGVFQTLMEEKDIFHVVKDKQDLNSLAPLDSLVGNLKRAIFRRIVADEDSDWAASLQKTVDGYNATPHSALQGRSPEEAPDDQELQFALRRFNSEAQVHNANVIHARDDKLKKLGAFRVQDGKRTFARSYQARYGNEVLDVVSAEGGIVQGSDGNEYKSRHTLAVPKGSESVAGIADAMRGGSKRIDRVRLQALEPYRQRIEEFVGDGKTENQVTRFMKSIDMDRLTNAGFNFRNMLALLGFSTGTGRGSSTEMVRKLAAPSAAAAEPVPPRAANTRPPRTPAEAASNLRGRITGKRPGV